MKASYLLSFPIFMACGFQPRFDHQCTVSGYSSCKSTDPVESKNIKAAENMARGMLIEAGVMTATEHDQQISGFNLYIHNVKSWYDNIGRLVEGETTSGSVEVGSQLTALLHEEIHMMHMNVLGDWDHNSWAKLGYWGLDTFYTDTFGDQAWTCEIGYGMTNAMVIGLRAHGRPIDAFLARNPTCLNKE